MSTEENENKPAAMDIQSAVQSEIDGDEIGRGFETSTHKYVVYFQQDGFKTLDKFLLGAFVILMQFILYGVIAEEGNKLLKDDEVDVKVPFDLCECVNLEANQNYWTTEDFAQCSGGVIASDGTLNLFDNIQCEATYPSNQIILLGAVLLAFFLQLDFIECFKIFFFGKLSAKLWALLVFGENIFALYCGSVFAFQGVGSGSGYNTIMNCVGILFVHDIDEKLYASIEALNEKGYLKKMEARCACFGGCCVRFQELICTLIFMAFVIIFGQIIVASGDPEYLITSKQAYD